MAILYGFIYKYTIFIYIHIYIYMDNIWYFMDPYKSMDNMVCYPCVHLYGNFYGLFLFGFFVCSNEWMEP